MRAGPDRAVRRADAVIFPDEPHGRVKAHDYPSLAGRNVIVVPTKPGRMGMYLMGQARFSARLVKAQGATGVRSILLCHKPVRSLAASSCHAAELELNAVGTSSLTSGEIC